MCNSICSGEWWSRSQVLWKCNNINLDNNCATVLRYFSNNVTWYNNQNIITVIIPILMDWRRHVTARIILRHSYSFLLIVDVFTFSADCYNKLWYITSYIKRLLFFIILNTCGRTVVILLKPTLTLKLNIWSHSIGVFVRERSRSQK